MARALMRPQVVCSTGTGRCWTTKTVVPLAKSPADSVNSTSACMLLTPTPSGRKPGPTGLDSLDGVDVKAGDPKALIYSVELSLTFLRPLTGDAFDSVFSAAATSGGILGVTLFGRALKATCASSAGLRSILPEIVSFFARC